MERVAQPSGGKAMRPNPSQEQVAQLSEQIHLGWLQRFNLKCGCWGGGGGCGFRGLCIPVEEVLELLKVFL